jgi:hypothetical protein
MQHKANLLTDRQGLIMQQDLTFPQCIVLFAVLLDIIFLYYYTKRQCRSFEHMRSGGWSAW